MPYIKPEVIKEVKKIDLLTYLKNSSPHELIKLSGGEFCLRSHDSLKISNGMWHWFSKNIGGRSALDYLIKVEEMGFTDAVMAILKGDALIKPAQSHVMQKERRAFTLPEKHKDNTMLNAYLEKRGIQPEIVREFTNAGMIYENHFVKNGWTFVNAVFLGRDEQGIPRQASLRGINSEYKAEARGSDKCYSFTCSAGKGTLLRVFESAIDLLSFLSLNKCGAATHKNEQLISLSGIYKPSQAGDTKLPMSICRYLKANPQIKKAALHLDNDEAGRCAAAAMLSGFSDFGVKAAYEPPEKGKDFNDYLLIRREGKVREREDR
jgi:hypothetical protein